LPLENRLTFSLLSRYLICQFYSVNLENCIFQKFRLLTKNRLSWQEENMNPQELKQLEDGLWCSAETLRANSDLKATEYSISVMGLIFLKFADKKYRRNEMAIKGQYAKFKGTRREKPVEKIAIEKCGKFLQTHIKWLQERLSQAEYEDVTGLCKSATPQEAEARSKIIPLISAGM
jgi:type I restriction enzyme M protein